MFGRYSVTKIHDLEKAQSVINEYIRNRVEMARFNAVLSQEQLGKHIGKTKVTISDIERGKTRVNIADLVIIARATGQPIEYFLPVLTVVEEGSIVTPF